jgi:hypothetical protein
VQRKKARNEMHDKVRVLFFENCHTSSFLKINIMACCKVLAKEKTNAEHNPQRNGKRKRGCKYKKYSTFEVVYRLYKFGA